MRSALPDFGKTQFPEKRRDLARLQHGWFRHGLRHFDRLRSDEHAFEPWIAFFEKHLDDFLKVGTGLFPAPAELTFECSCPDYASMCKHVAAVLYGIGARLDQEPGLLFQLRNVNEQDLVGKAGAALGTTKRPAGQKVLSGDLSKIVGIEIAPAGRPIEAQTKPAARRARRVRPASRKALTAG